MKITIQKLSKQVKQTKNGPKNSLGVYDGKQWYNCFEGPWNKSWKEGMTIEVEIAAREWNGKTFYDIQAPNPLADVNRKLDQILAIITKNVTMPTSGFAQKVASQPIPTNARFGNVQSSGAYPDSPPPPTDDDAPFFDDQDEVPF